jgi:predicted metal-binding transcription factor (methanogenesis marker protein 9)
VVWCGKIKPWQTFFRPTSHRRLTMSISELAGFGKQLKRMVMGLYSITEDSNERIVWSTSCWLALSSMDLSWIIYAGIAPVLIRLTWSL